MSEYKEDDKFVRLREQAEELIKQGQANFSPESAENIRDLIQELKVHQAELEIQNQELGRAQQENARLQREYQDLYEFAPSGYLTLSPKGIITRANLTAVSLLGTNRRLLLKSSFIPFITSDSVQAYRFARQKSIESGDKQSVELQLQIGSQGLKWVLVDIDVEKDDQDCLLQLRMNLVDITQRKQAEEDLRQSENYYRTIFETSGTAMFIIKEDTTISHVNSNFQTLTGYSRQELEGKRSWTEFVHPDDLDWMKDKHYLRRYDPDNAPRQYEFRMIDRHGEERNVLASVDMIPGTNQSIGSGIDITERKQLEDEVKEMRLFLGATLDSLSYHVAVLDQQGEIVLVNRPWSDFAKDNGISVEQVSEGTNYIAVCSQATGENSEGAVSFAEAIRTVISGESDLYNMEYPCHSPDKQRWFVGRVSPFPEAPPRRVVASHEDITQRKLVEEATFQQQLVETKLRKLAQNLISFTPLENIAEMVLSAGKELTESHYGYVGSIDSTSGNLEAHTFTRTIWET
ncbi:MAG: PAS domain S-box protein, partial [Desulfovermiculus sp.]